MTFGYLQKVIAILHGWRFTTTGNPVTPQLTNPLGAKLFYNKVPILKMRLTPYKSYKTEQLACANWTKMPSQRASVCPYPSHNKKIDYTPNGRARVGSFRPLSSMLGCLTSPLPQWKSLPAFAPHFQLEVFETLPRLTTIYTGWFITR